MGFKYFYSAFSREDHNTECKNSGKSKHSKCFTECIKYLAVKDKHIIKFELPSNFAPICEIEKKTKENMRGMSVYISCKYDRFYQ